MFSDNLVALRKLNKLTQEELAEKVGVSRQSLSKWETGESSPDIEKSAALAEALNVSLDELVNYSPQTQGLPIPPKGKHVFGVVKVGEKGQIVIPSKARKIFGIKPGDGLVVLGDENQGIALLNEKYFLEIIDQIKK